MAINKAHIVDNIYNNHNFSKTKSSALVESILEIIKRSLESGEDVMISGFGKFYAKNKNERRGRNPATGKDLILDARRVATFKCSDVIRNKMNGKE